MTVLNDKNESNKNAAASTTMNDPTSPESVVELLECKDCGHLVPCQNMALHQARACQPRKQPAQDIPDLEEEQPLTEPLLPDVVPSISPVASAPGIAIIPPPSTPNHLSGNYNNNNVPTAGGEVPAAAEAAAAVTSTSSPNSSPWWKNATGTWDRWTSSGPSQRNNNNDNVPTDAGGDAAAAVTSTSSPSSSPWWKNVTDTWERWTSCGPSQRNNNNNDSSSTTYPARQAAEVRQRLNNSSPTNGNSSNGNTNNTAAASTGWTCPRCTLDNTAAQQKCEACMYTNPEQRAPDAVQRQRLIGGNPSRSNRNNSSNDNRTSARPANYLSGGAILGGVLGAAGASLTGQSPVAGFLEGAMNGAVTGAIMGSAVNAQEQIQQQQRMAAASSRGGGVRVVRRRMPDGTPMTVLSRVGGRGPVMVRRGSVANDPFEAAMMESLMMGGGPMTARGGVGNANVDGMSYEQLLDAFGTGSEHLGADQEQIRTIPSSKVEDPSQLPEDGRECAICLEKFCKGSKRKTLPCLHGFHNNCVDQWLRTNASCPICKHRIDQ